MDTIRKYLTQSGFDFENGKIIIQNGTGWSEGGNGRYVKPDDPILDIEFSSGYGGPDCPRYVAQDKKKIYFPWQYDGATGPTYVYRNIKAYLGSENETPYPGG